MAMTNNNKCEWIGDGEGCTAVPVPGRSYCEEHLWRVHQKGTASSKRKKDIRVANGVWELESLVNQAVEELINEGLDL
jgi:hypothetical protein